MKTHPSQGFKYARNDKQNSRHGHQKYAYSPRILVHPSNRSTPPVDASDFQSGGGTDGASGG